MSTAPSSDWDPLSRCCARTGVQHPFIPIIHAAARSRLRGEPGDQQTCPAPELYPLRVCAYGSCLCEYLTLLSGVISAGFIIGLDRGCAFFFRLFLLSRWCFRCTNKGLDGVVGSGTQRRWRAGGLFTIITRSS